MSNIFVWNIYEKSFTPYWAKLAPKHQVHRHAIQRKPSKVSPFFQDPRMKTIIRFLRNQMLKRPAVYYFFIILCTFSLIFSRLRHGSLRKESLHLGLLQ